MSFLTKPFLGFVFAVEPIWLPLLILDLATIAVLVFKERMDPRSLIFWIATTVILPGLGVVLYLLFGCTLISDRMFGRKRSQDEDLSFNGKRLTDSDGVFKGGNGVRAYWSFAEAVPDLVADTEDSKETVHVMCRRLPHRPEFIDSLEVAARSGKHVCLMTSTYGFGRTRGLRRLRNVGVEFKTFRGKFISVIAMRPANRNMRSMMVIDGRIAYLFHDSVMRVEGPSASDMDMRFMADWAFASGSECASSAPCGASDSDVQVSVESTGPDCGGMPDAENGLADVISGTKSSLLIAAPYLTPNDDLYSHLKLAVFSGVEVSVLLPRRSNLWYQSWNSLAASNPLMMAGVRVFFTESHTDRFIMISDGSVCMMSTGSLTSRSLGDDLNLRITVRSEGVCSELASHFRDELAASAECHPEEYRRRSLMDVLKIATSRMLMFLN